MPINIQLETQIRGCIDDLNWLVSGKGCALTDPNVVKKSMELDVLILQAMRKPSYKPSASVAVFE